MNIPLYDEHYLNVLSSVYYDNIRQIERLCQTNHEIRDILLRAHANNRNRTNNRNRANNRNRSNRANNTQYMNSLDNRNYYHVPNSNYTNTNTNMNMNTHVNPNTETQTASTSQAPDYNVVGNPRSFLPRRFYFDASYNLHRAPIQHTPIPIRNNTFDTLLNAFLEPVPTYPGTLQIEIATRNVRYGDIISPINTSCPISLERFTDNDIVTIICYCGHIFMAAEIQNWFTSNCRCPVCRYDIREYRAIDVINHATDIPNNAPITNMEDNHVHVDTDVSGNLIDSITDTLLNELLNSASFTTDLSANLLENTLATFYFAFPPRERR
jgi:hypothetical protein